MSAYEKVIDEWQRNNKMDLVEFLSSVEPTSPQDTMICMGDFNVDKLRNGILWNIYRQCICLNEWTMKQLMEFLKSDFEDLTRKIYLQVLIHFVKSDTKQNSCGVTKEEIAQIEKSYNGAIISYIIGCNEKIEEHNVIKPVAKEIEQKIKKNLLSKPILKAIDLCLKAIDVKCNEEDLKKMVNSIDIYSVVNFAPLANLRGVCLLKGILFCAGQLPVPVGSARYEADLVTITTHEVVHFLSRTTTNNFNYNSPFSKDVFRREEKKMDPVFTNLPLELGRYAELIIFDGIQPNWKASSTLGAETFLSRLEKGSEDIPIIRKDEHQSLGIAEREGISSGFGIDKDTMRILVE